MKRLPTICALALALTMALASSAHAAEWAGAPTANQRSVCGGESRRKWSETDARRSLRSRA